MTSAPQSETIPFQKERHPWTGNREMDEDFSYCEDTRRGQLSTSEITSSGENRHLLQSLEDARDLGMSRPGGEAASWLPDYCYSWEQPSGVSLPSFCSAANALWIKLRGKPAGVMRTTAEFPVPAVPSLTPLCHPHAGAGHLLHEGSLPRCPRSFSQAGPRRPRLSVPRGTTRTTILWKPNPGGTSGRKQRSASGTPPAPETTLALGPSRRGGRRRPPPFRRAAPFWAEAGGSRSRRTGGEWRPRETGGEENVCPPLPLLKGTGRDGGGGGVSETLPCAPSVWPPGQGHGHPTTPRSTATPPAACPAPPPAPAELSRPRAGPWGPEGKASTCWRRLPAAPGRPGQRQEEQPQPRPRPRPGPGALPAAERPRRTHVAAAGSGLAPLGGGEGGPRRGEGAVRPCAPPPEGCARLAAGRAGPARGGRPWAGASPRFVPSIRAGSRRGSGLGSGGEAPQAPVVVRRVLPLVSLTRVLGLPWS